tara:strand:- start:374 stop:841 length:468 start_codon:yes stop_codon:yes gene_type:complete
MLGCSAGHFLFIGGGDELTKVVKSISLDEETAKLANAKSNFSEWVRIQLLTEIHLERDCVFFTRQIMNKKNKLITESHFCNGMSKMPCVKCWPQGAPRREDWLRYTKFEISAEDLVATTSELYQAIEKANPEPIIEIRIEKRYVRRFLKWLWSYI